MDVEIVLLDHTDSREYAGHYHDQQYECDSAFGQALTHSIHFFLHYKREAKILGREESGQGDEDAVDKEQVQRSEDVMPVEQGDAVSDRTKRGHEGRRYGDTGDNGATFLAGCLKHARDAAEQGYQHVVNGRIGPCEQFRGVAEVQRAQYEE